MAYMNTIVGIIKNAIEEQVVSANRESAICTHFINELKDSNHVGYLDSVIQTLEAQINQLHIDERRIRDDVASLQTRQMQTTYRQYRTEG